MPLGFLVIYLGHQKLNHRKNYNILGRLVPLLLKFLFSFFKQLHFRVLLINDFFIHSDYLSVIWLATIKDYLMKQQLKKVLI